MTLFLDTMGRAGASAGGAVLGAAARAVGAVRPASKPLHPSGRVVVAQLARHGSSTHTGVAFLDEPGDEQVLVRESRAAGLPRALPDVHGLAIRVSNSDGSLGDLLLASTGWGRLTRYLLNPSFTTYGRPMTTLLPYRSPRGPLLLGARSDGTGVVHLAFAVGRGSWHRFADLTVSDDDGDDPTVSFDPVANRVPGLEQYAAVVRLREPAYLSARRSRGDA